MSILKKLEKFFIAFQKWFLSQQTKNITTFPSPYRLTATPHTEEIKNKKTKKSHPLGTGKKIFLNRWLRELRSQTFSLCSASIFSIKSCQSLPKAHYFYCIKICALYRTSLMFLWELNNAIISQNLRELCFIETSKPSRKIPPFRVGEKNFSQ